MLCCHHCPRVAHKKCVIANGNDVPDARDAPWTCEHCVRQHDRINHDTRCLKCEQHDYMFSDLKAVCQLALYDAEAAGNSTDAATWAIVRLESVNDDIRAYHAHLSRDINQSMFQKHMFECVEKNNNCVTDLCDYWAKQGAHKQKTATCEGMANKGVSCHGRMFTFANPPQTIRDDHPEVQGARAVCVCACARACDSPSCGWTRTWRCSSPFSLL